MAKASQFCDMTTDKSRVSMFIILLNQ